MSNWTSEKQNFINNNPELAATLGTVQPASQLAFLKELTANSETFREAYPEFTRVINNTNELVRDLFGGLDASDIDDESLYEELAEFFGERLNANVIDMMAQIDHDVRDFIPAEEETLNGGEDTLNDTASGNPAVQPVVFEFHDGNSGFVVSETNRDAFVNGIVNNIRSRRANGLTLPPAFEGLSDEYVAQVAAARFDNARGNAGAADAIATQHEYAAKKANYGAAA